MKTLEHLLGHSNAERWNDENLTLKEDYDGTTLHMESKALALE
ncbi:MAG: hypothetical protein NTW85_00785 [Methylococcales bacterium]|nr:hypothetical protein [Methylococcales bacterium]